MTGIELPTPVQRVQPSLIAVGCGSRVIELKDAARNNAEAAVALGAGAGDIVKPRVCLTVRKASQ